MKHGLLSFFAAAVLFFVTLPCKAYDFSAFAPSGQRLYYNIVNGEAQVTQGSYPYSVVGDLIIPDTVTFGVGYPVTSIGNSAFSGCYSLASVTIPNSVTSIGNSAFGGCISLTNITIPNSVTSIGWGAFSHCTSLTSVTIPNSVTSIGDYTFELCSSLTSVTIPNSVTSIEVSAFQGDINIVTVVVMSGNPVYDSRNGCNAIIETASNTLIFGCSATTIPNSVTSIGDWAFSGCPLTSITFPNSVISIGDWTFSHCTSLTSVTIPNSVTSIGNNAFYGCTSLTSVTIPNSVTSIGGSAFSECSSLASVTIPNSVTSIGGSTFQYCTSLTSVTIPNSVTSIGASAFSGCSSLASVTIPNSVTSIEGGAFQNCSSLTSVTIPNSVTSIEYGTFQYCTSLTSVTIPNSVTSIGWYAFSNCFSLTSVTIPNSVTFIGNYAFEDCLIDTLNMSYFIPFGLGFGNTALSQANIINIPCGATANYQSIWGAGNYHEPDPAVLTLSALDNNGIVTIDSQNVQQSPLCVGSTVFIQATPNYGYHFTQWNDGNTDNPRTITVTQDTLFTALFAKNQYTLTITSNDNSIGTVSGGGTYEYLDEATLTATTTAAHHHFVQWSDGETDTLRTITVTEDLSLTAIFAIDTHQVSAVTNNELYGNVSGGGYFPYGSTVTLTPNPENGYYFVWWNNSDTTNPNTFTVTGDTLLSALFAPEIVPSICMVSVENDHNVLSWEKDAPVLNYNIYCEGNTSNVYELIATVPYTALSTYTDTSSRPRTRSYRYRLSATDIYGHEADLSDIHKTMHLTINQGVGNQWNLVWTEYEGADYTTYVIYRGTDANNIQQIDVMPSGGNITYTDVNAPQGDVYYQVGIMLSSPCNPTKSNYIVLSNIATNSTVGIHTSHKDDTKVYANNGHVMVSSESVIQDVRIFDITGKLLKTVAVSGNSTIVNISDYSTGVYMVQVHTANGYVTRKIVK